MCVKVIRVDGDDVELRAKLVTDFLDGLGVWLSASIAFFRWSHCWQSHVFGSCVEEVYMQGHLTISISFMLAYRGNCFSLSNTHAPFPFRPVVMEAKPHPSKPVASATPRTLLPVHLGADSRPPPPPPGADWEEL